MEAEQILPQGHVTNLDDVLIGIRFGAEGHVEDGEEGGVVIEPARSAVDGGHRLASETVQRLERLHVLDFDRFQRREVHCIGESRRRARSGDSSR